jgi:dephospho-CoA kinase
VTRFVGLTGGIGAGKSTALEALERLGAAVLSSDAIVHELYETDEVRDEIVGHFGETVAPHGVVDRAALARRTFASDADREWLEALVWPLVRVRTAAWHEHVTSLDPPVAVAVVEVPLLFEAGVESTFDATITVTAPERLRRERVAARGYAALDAREARQLSQEEKSARSTYVVVNDGDVGQLEAALSSVLEMLRQ